MATDTEVRISPINSSPTLCIAQMAIIEGERVQLDKLVDAESREHLKVLKKEEKDIRQVYSYILDYFRCEECTVMCFIVGGAAQAEIYGYSNWDDVDILLTGITRKQLLSEEFIIYLKGKGLEVHKWEADDRLFTGLKLRCKSGKEIDLFVAYKTEVVDKPISAFPSLVSLVDVIEAVEITNSYFFIYTLGKRRSKGPFVLPPYRVHRSADVMRYVYDVVSRPHLVACVSGLNRLRRVNQEYRRDEQPDENLDRILRVSGRVQDKLAKGLRRSAEAGTANQYLALLMYTGLMQTYFPVTMACCGPGLFEVFGGDTLNRIGKSGDPINGLNSLFNNLMPEEFLPHILFCADLNAGKIADLESLEGNNSWFLSYYWNRVIDASLVMFPVCANIFVKGVNGRKIPIHEIIDSSRTPSYLWLKEGTLVEKARAAFWYKVGPYLEAEILAEALRTDALQMIALRETGVKMPLLSVLDRYEVIYERINTIMIRLLASGRFAYYCRQALEVYEALLPRIQKRAEETESFVRGNGHKLEPRHIASINQQAAIVELFHYHLGVFSLPCHPLSIDEETRELIIRRLKEIWPDYRMVFDYAEY